MCVIKHNDHRFGLIGFHTIVGQSHRRVNQLGTGHGLDLSRRHAEFEAKAIFDEGADRLDLEDALDRSHITICTRHIVKAVIQHQIVEIVISIAGSLVFEC